MRVNDRNWPFLSLVSMIFSVVLCSLVLLSSCRGHQSDPKAGPTAPAAAPSFRGDTASLSVRPVLLKGTGKDSLWGYEIYAGGKLLIRQLNVPAASGTCGFASAADAGQIGNIVSHKLKTGQIPSVSLVELKQAGVVYKAYQAR